MSNGVNGTNGTPPSCPTHIRYEAMENIPETLEPDFVFPDLPSKCTWSPNKDSVTPHSIRPL